MYIALSSKKLRNNVWVSMNSSHISPYFPLRFTVIFPLNCILLSRAGVIYTLWKGFRSTGTVIKCSFVMDVFESTDSHLFQNTIMWDLCNGKQWITFSRYHLEHLTIHIVLSVHVHNYNFNKGLCGDHMKQLWNAKCFSDQFQF